MLKNGETLLTDQTLIQYTAVNATYAEARAMELSDGQAVWITDKGGGRFTYRAGDYEDLVAADEMTASAGDGRLIFALTSDLTGVTGACLRDDWVDGKPIRSEWWGLDPTGEADASAGLFKFFLASLRMGAYQADGIVLRYGGGRIQPGAFRIDAFIDIDLPDDPVFDIRGAGTHATRLIGSATNLDGVLRIRHLLQAAKGAKSQISDFTIETKAQGCEIGFDFSDRSGGLGNGTTHLLDNILVRAWDINNSWFKYPINFSGNSRLKFMNVAAIGPLDPGMPVNDYSDADTRWKPEIMINVSGCYDAQLHNVIIQGGKYGWYNVQGSSRDESGNRQGQAFISGTADNGGFLQLKLDGPDHGLTVTDPQATSPRKYRVSCPGSYQYHTASITSLFEAGGNYFAVTDIPFDGYAAAHPFRTIIAQDASGEGYGAVNVVINHSQYGIVSILAGQEASANIHRDTHLNCAFRNAYIDGGQQMRFEQILPYNNHYPDEPDATDTTKYPGGASDPAYIADKAVFDNAIIHYPDRMVDYEIVNFSQSTFRNFESRATEHPARTGFLLWNGPLLKAPTSISFEGMKIWGNYETYVDASNLGAFGKEADISLLNIDCSGLLPGATLVHAGPHCRASVVGFEYPDGILHGDADFIISDDQPAPDVNDTALYPGGASDPDYIADLAHHEAFMEEKLLVYSRDDYRAGASIRFVWPSFNVTVPAGGHAEATLPGKLPNGNWIIHAGPYGPGALIGSGMTWSAAAHNGDDIRVNFANQDTFSRSATGNWYFVCSPVVPNA